MDNNTTPGREVNPADHITPHDTRDELAFISRIATQIGMPHSRTTATTITRTNGTLTVSLSAGGGYPLPFGRYPRLFEIYAATMMKTGDYSWDPDTGTLRLGDTFRGFIRQLGVKPSGSSLKLVTRQLLSLLNASYHIINKEEEKENTYIGKEWQVATDYHISWDPDETDDTDPQSWVRFSPRYVAMLEDNPVPLSLQAVSKLTSSLAIDIYVWLAKRSYRLTRPTDTILWGSLQRQLSDRPRNDYDFHHEFRKALQQVEAVWPGLHVITGRRGVVIYPSAPQAPQAGKTGSGKAVETQTARTPTEPEPATQPDDGTDWDTFNRIFHDWKNHRGNIKRMQDGWRNACRKVGEDTVVAALERYMAENRSTEERWYRQLDTFLNTEVLYTDSGAPSPAAPVTPVSAGDMVRVKAPGDPRTMKAEDRTDWVRAWHEAHERVPNIMTIAGLKHIVDAHDKWTTRESVNAGLDEFLAEGKLTGGIPHTGR